MAPAPTSSPAKLPAVAPAPAFTWSGRPAADRPPLELLAPEWTPIPHQPPAADGALEQARALARLDERERIGMDFHDGVLQSLYAAALGLATRARLLDADPAQARAALRSAEAQIDAVIQEIRAYLFSPRSDGLTQRGLQDGLERLADELRRNTPVRPALELDAATVGLLDADADAVAHLLYSAREAASNAIRHAGASAVTIRVAREGGSLVLTVRDNGAGFDPARPAPLARRGGAGLRNLAARAERLGGRLLVSSPDSGGTEVRLAVPLPRRVPRGEAARAG